MQEPPAPGEELPVLTDIVELGPGVAATLAAPEPGPEQAPEPEVAPPDHSAGPPSMLSARVAELLEEIVEEASGEAVVLLQERVRARLQRELPGLLDTMKTEQDKQD